jgi:ubiquinone/menaquinone biosynthesis C-methylase UbiE
MREGASMTKSQPVSVKDEIQKWWADNPMTYGGVHGETSYEGKELAMGSKAFFERLDREFYDRSTPLHRQTPFDQLFQYEEYPAGSRVLEVGCGLGTMAMNWAKRGMKMTAVDLNPISIQQTKKRFETYGLEGEIRLEDANELSFEDGTFDYTYSWGVLHHSPNLEKSVAEMMRVTRPGGGFGIMLYNRNSFLYRYTMRFIEGFLHFESEFLSPLELASRYADASREEGNPYTWPVTRSELEAIFKRYSNDLRCSVLDTGSAGLFLWLWPGLGLLLPRFGTKVWARRFGWFLWITGHRA